MLKFQRQSASCRLKSATQFIADLWKLRATFQKNVAFYDTLTWEDFPQRVLLELLT